MGAYAYCEFCDSPMPAPWDLTNFELLNILHGEDEEITCRNCDKTFFYFYDRKNIIEELAERLDKINNKGDENG